MEPQHHEHNHRLTSLNKTFIIGIALNITFVIVEFGVGFYYNSLGLLSDAGHNLGDVAVTLEFEDKSISCETKNNCY